MYDVLVVGMGPSGSMAAHGLAKKGFKVLAIDKDRFPRYKSCGGCISTKVDKILDFDISEVVDDTVMSIDFNFKSARPVTVPSDKPIAYNVMRSTFDAFLAARAVAEGVEFREGVRVRGPINTGDIADTGVTGSHIELNTDDGLIKARYVIGADGAGGVIGRSLLGLNYRNSHITLTSEVSVDDATLDRYRGKCLVDFGVIPHGYAWIFPKKDGLSVGIAGMNGRLERGVKDYFKDFIEDQDALDGTIIESGDIRGWTIPVYHGKGQEVYRGRALVTGDAAHLVDPFLGEGIYYAIRSGQIAADAVGAALGSDRGDLSNYKEMLSGELYPEFEACSSLVKIIYGYPRVWYRVVEMDPSVMQRYYNVLTGDESGEQFIKDLKSRIVKKPWKVLSKWLRG